MRRRGAAILLLTLLGLCRALHAEEPGGAASPLSAKAEAALQLTRSDDAYQQQLGFLRLEALREPASVPYLQAAAADRHPDIRAYGLRALASVQAGEALPTLIDRAQHDLHPRVRRAAILGLETLAGLRPEVLPVLITALEDRASEVRMAAVDAVSRIDHPEARAALLLRQRRERRRDVRRVLALAMQRLGT
jgi:HEAT repeat protein